MRSCRPAFLMWAGTPARWAPRLGARAALDGFYDLVYKSMLMYLYAELNKSGDNGDPEYQAMNERAMMLLVQLNTAASYITPELATLPTETLQAYLHAPELELYRHQIADIIRVRKHVLSPEQEKMLSMLADAAQTPDNSFTMLESVDMTFPTIRDENGEEVQLTHGSFGVYRESADRRVRQSRIRTVFRRIQEVHKHLCGHVRRQREVRQLLR